MKLSNSKKELARIISESGGWRHGEFAAQDSDGGVGGYGVKPEWDSLAKYWWRKASGQWFFANKIKNHHQTVLSRAEYLHIYPVPDADGWIEWKGGECPVGAFDVIEVRYRDYFNELNHIGESRVYDWVNHGSHTDIIAYRPHKSEQSKPEFCESVMRSIPEPTANPTIEQLTADYRNAKDYAERKQQEAYAAKADADEKLRVLELAGEALGLLVSPIATKQYPELVITDWRDLRAGDVISVSGKWWEPDSEYTVDENDGSRDAPIRVGGYWAIIGECSFKFIRRP